MAHRATLLTAYGAPNDLILAGDGRSRSAHGLVADDARKVTLCGPRSACGIGGYCEGTVKAGSRAGWHWRLIDAFSVLPILPSRSAEDRAAIVFEAAYASALEYLPFDTDPGTLGVEQDGIVVLYGEVSRSGSIYLSRADFPVAIAEGLHRGFNWSVQPPSIKTIFPRSKHALPFIYCHSPELLASARALPLPPLEDNELANSITSLSLFGGIIRPSVNVGGQLTCARINNMGARLIRHQGP